MECTLSIEWKGDEYWRREFLWKIITTFSWRPRDCCKDDTLESAYPTMDALVSHVQERVKEGHCGFWFPVDGTLTVTELRDGFIRVNAEVQDLCELFGDIVDSTNSLFRDLLVTVCLESPHHCGKEYFKFKYGLVEQWFENDRVDTGVWVPCLIRWHGSQAASRDFLNDITARAEINAGPFSCYIPPLKPERFRWRGKPLCLDRYYRPPKQAIPLSIADGELSRRHISFDIYNTDFEKRAGIIKMFNAIAAAHPALEFDMRFSSPDQAGSISETKFFIYKNGKRASVQSSAAAKDALSFASRSTKYYRYSLPLNIQETARWGGSETLALLLGSATSSIYCNDELLMRCVPKAYQTKQFFLSLVKQNGSLLSCVPEAMRTADICRAAVLQTTLAIHDMPESLRTPKFYIELMRLNPEGFLRIPTEHLTRQVCMEAIKGRGAACGHIPKELQSEEFFLEAVRVNQNGKALKYVPNQYRTKKVCAAALKHHPGALSADELLVISRNIWLGGNGEAALVLLDKVIETAPAQPHACRMRGRLYLEQGEYNRAIADLTTALKHRAGDPDFDCLNRIDRGDAYYHTGAYDKAIADYSAALKGTRQCCAVYERRADAQLAKGSYARAIADYTAALNIEPGNDGIKALLENARTAKQGAQTAPKKSNNSNKIAKEF